MKAYFLVCFFLVLGGCAHQSPQSVASKPQSHPVVAHPEVVHSHKPTAVIKPDPKLLRKLARRNVVILDVRTAEEHVNGSLVGSRSLDFLQDNFQAEVAKLDKKKTYLLYCGSGSRAGKAVLYFQAQGLKAENLGALEDLRRRGAKIEGIQE